jgi:hypothetical protein
MTDVRLTATNPDDSSVVPVACNAKGELLLDESSVFDGNLNGNLSVSGSGDFGGHLGAGTYITTGNARIDASGGALFGQILLGADGSATFPKDAKVNGITVGHGSGSGNTNTAIGQDALSSNTEGTNNTAIGQDALSSNTEGSSNTVIGYQALSDNINGGFNTAIGQAALLSNTEGSENTATGRASLLHNTSGSYNTANGVAALRDNINGEFNTATGFGALLSNTEGSENTATGRSALFGNTSGKSNTANGHAALLSNTNGEYNTAIGHSAGYQLTGNNNTFVGCHQGFSGLNNTVSISAGTNERMRISADGTVDFNQKCGFTSDGGLWITDQRGNTLRTTFASNGILAWEEFTFQKRNEPEAVMTTDIDQLRSE